MTYRSDALRAGAAVAHTDAAPNDKRAAHRWHVSRRTATRWRTDGPPQVRDCANYLAGCDSPTRVVAYLAAVAQADVRDMGDAALIAAYRTVRHDEVVAECDDRLADVDAETPWAECAARSERDAAIDIRKAAIEREFHIRRISREEVARGA